MTPTPTPKIIYIYINIYIFVKQTIMFIKESRLIFSVCFLHLFRVWGIRSDVESTFWFESALNLCKFWLLLNVRWQCKYCFND